jgi:hypothetical protein
MQDDASAVNFSLTEPAISFSHVVSVLSMLRNVLVLLLLGSCLTQLGASADPTKPPTASTDPINLKKNAVLYHLDFYKSPPISPAMQSVMALTMLYYLITFGKALVQIQQYRYDQEDDGAKKTDVERAPLNGSSLRSEKTQKLLKKAQYVIENMKDVMEEIPMLAILIVFARLRARVDMEGSVPQSWTQILFYVSVGILYMQAFVITCCQPGDDDKAEQSSGLKKCVKLLKLVLTGSLMCCVVGIMVSIFTLKKYPIYAE